MKSKETAVWRFELARAPSSHVTRLLNELSCIPAKFETRTRGKTGAVRRAAPLSSVSISIGLHERFQSSYHVHCGAEVPIPGRLESG